MSKSVLIALCAIGVCLPHIALIVIAVRRYRRSREREPAINYDALQNELDEEFAPLPVERAARLSA